MIMTALKNYVHELAQHDKKKANAIGIIQIKNFKDKVFLVFDDETIREISWDDITDTLPITDVIKLYMNKSSVEIEFKESNKDKD